MSVSSIHYTPPDKRYGFSLNEFAHFFRSQALKIDQNPDAILAHYQHEALQFLINDRDSTVYRRTFYLEALGYGDPGVLLACPGPSLSGLIIRELGTREQIDYFYQYLTQHHARSFFALTEPEVGSDAAALQCRIDLLDNKWVINGEKCLFGNGASAPIGVVLARTHAGPLGIRAILITADHFAKQRNWISRQSLPMTGLRGAQVAYMQFQQCEIEPFHLLGEQHHPATRGIMAVIKTFNRLRSGVGALAIGQAQAVLDYIYEHKFRFNTTEKALYQKRVFELDCVRQQLRCAAKVVDANPNKSVAISIAKYQATLTAQKTITDVISMLPPHVFIENEWLAKCYRDCFAWEYMEGTSHIQLHHIYNDYQSKRPKICMA